QDAAREERARKKADAVARKAAKQADRLARWAGRGADIRFSGSLSTKSKEDLIDIANLLQIESTGIKAELLKAIRHHFETHQDLKCDA
ncbi:hypothetical protein PISMIDRAFT_78276, partial [Pisolithus microcarpus 441]